MRRVGVTRALVRVLATSTLFTPATGSMRQYRDAFEGRGTQASSGSATPGWSGQRPATNATGSSQPPWRRRPADEQEEDTLVEDDEGVDTTPPAAAAGGSSTSTSAGGGAPSAPPAKEAPVIRIHDGNNKEVSVQPIRHFADVAEDLPPWLVKGIRDNGYTTPTPVQSVSIPLLMEERDVIGIAPTGSGKTVAFAIPALSTITPRGFTNEGIARPKVLVMCPTRELVQQTSKVMLQLGCGVVKVSHAFGGQDRDVQANFLSRGCDVLVAAPGRLCDFLESNVISLDAIDFLVFDEADRMLEMGFARQIAFIMSKIDPKRKRTTMMWTATWHAKVQALSADYLHPNPLKIVVGSAKDGINKDIEQRVTVVDHDDSRIGAVAQMYDTGVMSSQQQVIVFAKTQEATEWVASELAQNLRHHGLTHMHVQCIHGRMKQNKRAAIVEAFREGRIRVLVATDVASRGLDFPAVDHVVNFDLPNDVDAYVHRIGRTGRAGRKGTAHTVVPSNSKAGVLGDLARYFEKNNITVSEDFHHVARRTIGAFDPRARRSKYLAPGEAGDLGTDWRGSAPVRSRFDRPGRGGGSDSGGYDRQSHHRGGPISVRRPTPIPRAPSSVPGSGM